MQALSKAKAQNDIQISPPVKKPHMGLVSPSSMAIVDEIKSRLDILDVVSQYAQLQRSGRSYKALCPFHTEKTPSFFVFPERQSWRCFGACATGGDIFSFLMRRENLDFSEALKSLARQAGVDLAQNRERKGEQDVLYQINEAAREFFCDLLASRKNGPGARAYLKKRGLTQETIDTFQLGLSPGDGESLKDHLESKGYTKEQLALAGLITHKQGEEYRSLFRRRLMFPIRDAEGRLSGFGGRALDDSQPKYLNSPKSPIFDKANLLYALHVARDSIKGMGVVIVEGYMDAIAAHQNGFSNVVASMGTALTRQQVSLVSRLIRQPGSTAPKEVFLALDPDTAGQEATLRSLESSWQVFQTRPAGRAQGTTLYERQDLPPLKVVPLPPGKDPDEIILESPEAWSSLVNNAVPLMDYLFTALSLRLDLSAPQGKARVAELLFPLIAATPDPFQQDYYFQRLAALLEVNEATLEASLGRPRLRGTSYRNSSTGAPQSRGSQSSRSGGRGQEAAATPFARMDHDPLEEYCLAMMLQYPQVGRPYQPSPAGDESQGRLETGVSDEITNSTDAPRLEHFRRVENREVFTNWIKCSTLDVLKESLDDELKGHLEHLLMKELPPSDGKQREAAFRSCIRRLEERLLRELNTEVELRLSQAPPEERPEQEQIMIHVNERLKRVLME